MAHPVPETPKRRARYNAVVAATRQHGDNLTAVSRASGIRYDTVRQLWAEGYGAWAPPVRTVWEATQKTRDIGARSARQRFLDILASEVDEDAAATRREEAVLVALLRRTALTAVHGFSELLAAASLLAEAAARALLAARARGEIDTKTALSLIKGLMEPATFAATLAKSAMELERKAAGMPEASLALVLADQMRNCTDEELAERLAQVQINAGRTLTLLRGGKDE